MSEPAPLHLDVGAAELREAHEGESYLNYLGAREIDDDPNMRIVNTWLDGELIASIKYDLGRTVGGHLFVHHVHVRPAARGQGLMRRLGQRAVDDAFYEHVSRLDGDFTDARLRDWFESLLDERLG